MTSIIVKGADFSAGQLSNYVPPVAGATLAAFVGDERKSFAMRNFGSGKDLSIYAGDPQYQGKGFRRFGPGQAFLTDSYYTEQMTFLAVCKSVYPLGSSRYGILIASERDAADGGRRGVGMARIPSSDYWRVNVNGTLSGAAASASTTTSATGITEANSAGFLSATVGKGTAANTVALAINRYTDPAKSGSAVSAANATFAPATDEQSSPLLVGFHYRGGTNYDPLDIGFMAVYPRILTADEIATMYQSVRRRFASLGVSI
jgi:hypothetical protein